MRIKRETRNAILALGTFFAVITTSTYIANQFEFKKYSPPTQVSQNKDGEANPKYFEQIITGEKQENREDPIKPKINVSMFERIVEGEKQENREDPDKPKINVSIFEKIVEGEKQENREDPDKPKINVSIFERIVEESKGNKKTLIPTPLEGRIFLGYEGKDSQGNPIESYRIINLGEVNFSLNMNPEEQAKTLVKQYNINNQNRGTIIPTNYDHWGILKEIKEGKGLEGVPIQFPFGYSKINFERLGLSLTPGSLQKEINTILNNLSAIGDLKCKSIGEYNAELEDLMGTRLYDDKGGRDISITQASSNSIERYSEMKDSCNLS
jgi:hypothetical protein